MTKFEVFTDDSSTSDDQNANQNNNFSDDAECEDFEDYTLRHNNTNSHRNGAALLKVKKDLPPSKKAKKNPTVSCPICFVKFPPEVIETHASSCKVSVPDRFIF